MSYESDAFEEGFPVVEGRYSTQNIRVIPSLNREVEVCGLGTIGWYDTKAFLEAVLLAVEFADEGVVAEVMAERAGTAATDASVVASAEVKIR